MRIKTLTLIPFNLPWDWSTDYTNQTAYVLSKRGLVICYMLGDLLSIKEYLQRKKIPHLFKRYSQNIYLFYPILLIPFRRFKTVLKINNWINLELLKLFTLYMEYRHNIYKKIIWNFDPIFGYITEHFNKGWIKVYDCVDYFAGSAKTAVGKSDLLKKEKRLLKSVDYVFANSTVLYDHLKPSRSDVTLVPQGFRVESFKKFKKSRVKIKTPGRPLIGFVGAVNPRINYDLIHFLAVSHPEWDFALWGKKLELDSFTKHQNEVLRKLESLPNIIRGESPKNEVPGIVSQFDIGMIPYDSESDFNKYCYPMKLFEFFYLGKPVISTEIKELKRFPDLVYISDSKFKWEKQLLLLIRHSLNTKLRNKAKKLAIKNSWENKVSQILNYIDHQGSRKLYLNDP